tara:strand:- start:1975 stop:3216 length:1242 start_codon:yes stop_codon:yes gene_type:complete
MLITLYVLLVGFLILLSAFFSGSETAFLNLKLHRKNIPDRIKLMFQKSTNFLTSVLSANTIINISIASISAHLIHDFFSDSFGVYLWIIEIFIVGMVILLFGEILPKRLAMKHSISFAKMAFIPLKFFLFIISPIAFIVNIIIKCIMFFFPFVKREKVFDTEEELKIATEIVEESGTIKEEESDMIQSVLEFDNKMVRQIMTPRVDIASISSNNTIDELMDLIKEKKYSKLPLYDNNVDNIKGIIYAKDVLPYLLGSRSQDIKLSDFCKEPYFVPENKPIDDLLEDFRNRKTQIAVVVDEWGGTAGLVTVEDIVEEVFGEIRDPYDIEKDFVINKKDGTYLLDASIGIYDIEEELDIEFPQERDYDTLGGYIFFKLGKIPNQGDSVKFNSWTFTVITLLDNRIKKVEAKIDEQ